MFKEMRLHSQRCDIYIHSVGTAVFTDVTATTTAMGASYNLREGQLHTKVDIFLLESISVASNASSKALKSVQ